MEGEQPIKEGFLHKAHPKESFLSVTVWQKRYFVLWSKGTLEYYSNYTKKAEEYCGTLDLLKCQDMVAPMIVGKRHNIIKLTVFKNDKIKDYWLDCDCPPLLNEWIKSLAEASGLSPDDSSKNKLARAQNPPHPPPPQTSNVQLRPLPTAPPPTDSANEQESDEEILEGDTYEEIEDTPNSPSISEGASLRRFTRSFSDKRNTPPAVLPPKNNISPNHALLKRAAIKETPPTSKKPPPPPLKPHPPSKPRPETNAAMGSVDFNELQQTIKRRTSSSKSPEDLGEEGEGPTEAYEEVQFSADVIVGTPRLPPRQNESFPNLSHKEPSGYTPFNEVNKDQEFGVSYSPCSTPSVPPRDSSFSFSATPSSPPPLPPRDTSPEIISKVKSRMRSPSTPPLKPHNPLPPPPPSQIVSSSYTPSSSLPPPLPPPRDASNRSPVPFEREEQPIEASPPPPVPRRNQSDRTIKSHAHPRIKPYRTTDLNLVEPCLSTSPPPDHTPSDNFATVRHTNPVKAPPIVNSKPHPPVIKPKPTKSAKPIVRNVNHSQTFHSSEDYDPISSRAPAVLPKPKSSSISQRSTLADNPSRAGPERGRGKRPPMPPPKPK